MATLLGFQLAGEVITRLGQLPISGPVCGMAVLLAWLHFKGEIESQLAKVSDGLLANMAILFVPVGVGAMSYSGLFADYWHVISLAILVGCVVTLLTTAFVTRVLIARTTSSAMSGERQTQQGRSELSGELSSEQ